MKIISKEIMIPTTVYEFIASDGQVFKTMHECEIYEHKLGFQDADVVTTAIHDFKDFECEHPMVIYNVKNEDDWNLLVERVWFDRQNWKSYRGPGHYIAIELDGGDYASTYWIDNAEEYITDYVENAQSYYDQITEAMKKFDT